MRKLKKEVGNTIRNVSLGLALSFGAYHVAFANSAQVHHFDAYVLEVDGGYFESKIVTDQGTFIVDGDDMRRAHMHEGGERAFEYGDKIRVKYTVDDEVKWVSIDNLTDEDVSTIKNTNKKLSNEFYKNTLVTGTVSKVTDEEAFIGDTVLIKDDFNGGLKTLDEGQDITMEYLIVGGDIDNLHVTSLTID